LRRYFGTSKEFHREKESRWLKKSIVFLKRIEKSIWLVLEQMVMINRDLAEYYGFEIKRFPKHFLFQLKIFSSFT